MEIDYTELSNRLNEIIEEVELSTELIPIGNRIYAEFDRRVFEEGKNRSGKIRRNYKTKGYEEYKKTKYKIFPTGYVNLRKTEDMRKGIKNLGYKQEAVQIGFNNDDLSRRFEYNERRFGRIRGATKEERELASELVTELILRKLTR